MKYEHVLATYRQKATDARLRGSQQISQFVGFKVAVSEISLRALEAHTEWAKIESDRHRFDWSVIRHKFRTDPKRLEMAIWVDDVLCGLSLGLLTNAALELRFLQGSPSPSCPLKGKRLLTALECAANYTQACGRKEIRLEPINEGLVELYRDVYGFSMESPKGRKPYFKKEV